MGRPPYGEKPAFSFNLNSAAGPSGNMGNTAGVPLNAGAGPSNAGAGPSNAGAGPLNAGVGSSNAGAGPSHAGAGPSNAVAGPSNVNKAVSEPFKAGEPTKDDMTENTKAGAYLAGPSNEVAVFGKRSRKKEDLAIYEFKFLTFERVISDHDFIPMGRSGHRIVCSDKCLYSYGGFNPIHRGGDGPILKELLRYHFYSRKWDVLMTRELPEELASPGVAACGNFMLIHGGTGSPFGASILGDTMFVNLQLEKPKLQHIAVTGEEPIPHYGQGMCVYNNCMYVVGGTAGTDYSFDMHKLDLKTRIWEKLTPTSGPSTLPMPRYRHEIVVYKDSIYVLGGGTSGMAFDFETISAFDLNTLEWSMVMMKGYKDAAGDNYIFPMPRRCHAISQQEQEPHKIFILGGLSGTSTYYSDTWMLDLEKLQWTRMLRMEYPTPVHFHSAHATSQGCLYSFGGLAVVNPHHGNATRRTNDVFRAWTMFPKLKYIAWDAVSYYVQNGEMTNEEIQVILTPEFKYLCTVPKAVVPGPWPMY